MFDSKLSYINRRRFGDRDDRGGGFGGVGGSGKGNESSIRDTNRNTNCFGFLFGRGNRHQ